MVCSGRYVRFRQPKNVCCLILLHFSFINIWICNFRRCFTIFIHTVRRCRRRHHRRHHLLGSLWSQSASEMQSRLQYHVHIVHSVSSNNLWIRSTNLQLDYYQRIHFFSALFAFFSARSKCWFKSYFISVPSKFIAQQNSSASLTIPFEHFSCASTRTCAHFDRNHGCKWGSGHALD